MAWNDSQNSNRGNNNSGGPPDLDEIFRQIKDSFQKWWNGSAAQAGGGFRVNTGNSGMAPPPNVKKLVISGLVASLLFYVYWGITIIQPGYEGALFRLGRYVETLPSGQHWTAPIFERVEQVNVQQVSTVNVAAHHMLTGDENIVTVEVAVSYRVNNMRDYLMQMVRPPRSTDARMEAAARRLGVSNLNLEHTMSQVTDSALRQVMGASKLDAILTTGRSVTAQNIHRHIQELLDAYGIGIHVESVNLQQISAPEEVKDAFDDVMRAREDERTYENQANSYAKKVVPEAQGRATRMEAEAHAYKEQVLLKAQGDLAKFSELYNAYKSAPQLVKWQLYVDTMQSVFRVTKPVFLDTLPGQTVYLGVNAPLSAPIQPPLMAPSFQQENRS